MCKFLLTDCMELISKTCESVSLFHRISFLKAKNNQNLKNESGSKQRFSWFQEKVIIQAVCLRTQAVRRQAGF